MKIAVSLQAEGGIKALIALVGQLSLSVALRKHAYSNILKFLQPKKETFQIKNSDIFHIRAQNIDCGYSLKLLQRGSSNEYPQKVGIKGVKII